jgi:Lrp/AsnC family transcriptional regulator for asnA, asnC and gidA
MKERKIRLLNELRTNCRRSLTEIGKIIGMPLSTVFKAVDELCKGLIITKHACLVDFAKLCFPYRAGIFIEANRKDGLKNFLAEHPNLNTLLRLSGDYDFYAEFIFKDMTDFEDFADKLRGLEMINKISTHFVSDVKREEFKIETNQP